MLNNRVLLASFLMLVATLTHFSHVTFSAIVHEGKGLRGEKLQHVEVEGVKHNKCNHTSQLHETGSNTLAEATDCGCGGQGACQACGSRCNC